jgi:hypothetical protein
MHCRANTDIRDDAHHNDGVNLKVPQREVKIGVEESRIAPLDYKNVFGARVEIIDNACAPRAFDAMRRSLQKFSVALHVRPMVVYEEYNRSPGFSRRADDCALRRDQALIARENHSAAGFAKVIQHIDDQNRRSSRIEPDNGLDLMVY